MYPETSHRQNAQDRVRRERILPADRVHQIGNEMSRGERNHETDAGLHCQHGANVALFGKFNDRGRELR